MTNMTIKALHRLLLNNQLQFIEKIIKYNLLILIKKVTSLLVENKSNKILIRNK